MWLKQHLAWSLALAMKRAREAAEADLDELDAWCKMELADADRIAAVRLQAPTTPTGSPPPKSLQFVEALVPGVRTRISGTSSAAQPQLSRFAIKSSGSSAAQPKPRAESSGSSAAPQAKLVATSKASQLPTAKAARPKPTSAAMAAKPKPTSGPQAYLRDEADERLRMRLRMSRSSWS